MVAVVLAGVGAVLAVLFAGHAGASLPGPVRQAAWVVAPLLGAVFLFRGRALHELGLATFDGRGVAVAVGGSLAMLAGLALGGGEADFDVAALWEGAWRPGLFEELVFRGFAFGLLFWRAGWSFPVAMLSTAALFGACHLPGAIVAGTVNEAWGAVLVTGAGGAWFAWLYARWNRSLWVPIAMHAAMNTWWVLFTAGPTAASGGAGATWGRVAAIAIVTVATIKLTTPSDGQVEAAPGQSAVSA